MKDSDFLLAIDELPVPTLITKLTSGEIVFANKAFIKFYGYVTLSELVGKLPPDFWLHPEHRKEFVETLALNGEVSNFTTTGLHLVTKQTIEILLSAKIISLNGEKHVLSGVFDVTDRVRLRARLREQVEILERSLDWYLVLDAATEDLMVVYANTAMRQHCAGICAAQPLIEGHPFIHCHAFSPLGEKIKEVAKTKIRADLSEFKFACPNESEGVVKYVDVQIYPVNGHVVVCCRDLEPAIYSFRRNIAAVTDQLETIHQKLGASRKVENAPEQSE